MKRFLSALFVFTAVTSFAQFQPMAVLKGRVIFGSSGSGNRAAYCLDYFADVPAPGNSFGTTVGNARVKITFSDATTETVSIKDAGRYFEISGTDDHRSVRFVQAPSLPKRILAVDILDAFVSKGVNYSNFSDTRLLEKLQSVSGYTVHDEILQESIWMEEILEYNTQLQRMYPEHKKGWEMLSQSLGQTRGPRRTTSLPRLFPEKRVAFSESTEGDFRVYTNRAAKEQKTFIDYIKLVDGGSATIFRNTTGEVTLIDVGKSRADAMRIIEVLKRDYQTASIKLNITHPDGDHLGGLAHLLANGIDVTEIILPKPRAHADTEEKTNALDSLLKPDQYEKISDAGLVRFVRRGRSPIETTPLKSRPLTQIEANAFTFDKQVRFYTYQYVNPKTTNDHSIMTKILYNEVSQLNLGDAGKMAIQALLKRNDELLAEIKSTREKISAIEIKLAVPQMTYRSPEEYLRREMDELLKERKIEHTNKATVGPVMREVVRRQKKEFDEKNRLQQSLEYLTANLIESTILQWPHHWWLLDLDVASNKAMYDKLLDQVDPKIIIFTTPPTGTRQDSLKLKNYVQDYYKRKSKHIKLEFLGSSEESIRIISMLFHNAELLAYSHKSFKNRKEKFEKKN